MTESEEHIRSWKENLLKALGRNGHIITQVIPMLELIIGKHPPVPMLSPHESQNRFHYVFKNFVQTLATKDHPLVLFLDDLQWVDSASLDLIELLLTEFTAGYLLLIGAYRDNEVSASHPLIQKLKDIRKSGVILPAITLRPLEFTHINQLIADTFHCTLSQSEPLARL